MFEIKKTFEIAGSHSLTLPYDSPCQRRHGHNWIISVYCRADDDTVERDDGMVVDFAHIKREIHGALDHQHLNDVLGDINPTAENIAKWICERTPRCYKVEVQESSGNVATYFDDSFDIGGF